MKAVSFTGCSRKNWFKSVAKSVQTQGRKKRDKAVIKTDTETCKE